MFLGMVLGAILAILIFGTNLLGSGHLEQLRSFLGTHQQTQQPAVTAVKPTQPVKRLPKTPAPAAPAPCCTPQSCTQSSCTPSILTPAPMPDLILTGQPQAYYNSWGWWLVDPNGSFHCPPVANPGSWTGGMKILVQRPGSPPYETWAPACYR